MHPVLEALTDRHETNQSHSAEYQHQQPQVYVPDMSSLAKEIHLLTKVAEQQLAQIALTDREPPQSLLQNFPVRGMCRYIVRRTGEGGDYLLGANSTTLILEANEARIGGQIVVIGSGSVKLFLTVDLQGISGNLLTGATPCIGLNASGGAWDLRIDEIPWCGNVVAVVGATATEVTVAAF